MPRAQKFSPVDSLPKLEEEPDYVIKTRPPMWDDWRLNIFRGIKENRLKMEANKLARRKCWRKGKALEECTVNAGRWNEKQCKPYFKDFLDCCYWEQQVEMDKLRRDVKKHDEWWWLCLYDENGEIGKQAEWKIEEKLHKMYFKNIIYNMIFKTSSLNNSPSSKLAELQKTQGDLDTFKDKVIYEYHLDTNKIKGPRDSSIYNV